MKEQQRSTYWYGIAQHILRSESTQVASSLHRIGRGTTWVGFLRSHSEIEGSWG
jgi:hypothetical protein